MTKKDLSHFYAFAAFLDAYKKEVFRLTFGLDESTFELLTRVRAKPILLFIRRESEEAESCIQRRQRVREESLQSR